MKSAEMAGGEELAWAATINCGGGAVQIGDRDCILLASYDVDIRFRCVINYTFVHSFGSIN